jgi:hypothetical protein
LATSSRSRAESAGDDPPIFDGTPLTPEALITRLAQLGEVQFGPAEAAQALGLTEAELNQTFVDRPLAQIAFKAGRLRGLEILRRAQLDLARSNATMAMFLGRTYLGQGERGEAADGESFDVAGASERVRNKVAAVLAASSSNSRRARAAKSGQSRVGDG